MTGLLDPSRPTMGDRPAYGPPGHGPIAVLPELLVWPQGGGLCRVSAWLATEAASSGPFRRFESLLDTRELPSVLESYRLDPEGVLERLFAWVVPTRRSPTASPPRPKPGALDTATLRALLLPTET